MPDSIKLTRKQCNTSNFMTSTNIRNILKYANVRAATEKLCLFPIGKFYIISDFLRRL